MSKLFSQIDEMDRKVEVWNFAFSSKDVPCRVWREILLWEKNAVITYGSDMDDPALYVTQPDLDGNCMIRVPHSAIEKVYTNEEVWTFDELEYIDSRIG
jgi:hypothetical protein